MWWNILVSLLLLPSIVTAHRDDCSQNEYDRCVRIADPLIKEAHLVFPDNLKDIGLVCSTWNMFVDCLKTYTDNCFTAQQRKQFNSAVESPIESVHQMCMQSSYQKEYLLHAPCIKSTIVERIHCGPHYNVLVDQVEQGDIISKSTLCCSHDRFKQCVHRETRKLCDRGNPNGPASRFAMQIIDKALRFLQDQCINYIPNSGDCVSPQDSMISYSDRSDPTSIISTASSEVYPWSTIQHAMAAKEILPSRIPKVSTSTNWLPTSGPVRENGGDNVILPDSPISPTQNLGTRARPGSYGRSNSWSTEPSTSSSNTLPMFPGISSTPPNFRENFGTAATWDVYAGYNNQLDDINVSASPPHRPTDRFTTAANHDSPSSSFWTPSIPPTTTTQWYLAAGHQIHNGVDEPNQLGLRNSALSSLKCNGFFQFTVIWSLVFGRLFRTLA